MTSNETGAICSGELDAVSSKLLAVLNIIFGMFSVGGNTIVLVAIWRTPSLRSTISNYFIASLASADLFVGLIINPMWAVQSSLNIWQTEHWLTTFSEFLSMQSLFTTTYSLACVSYDRYVAVTSVFRYLNLITPRRSLVSLVVVWVLSFAFASIRYGVTDPFMLPYLWLAVAVVCYTIPFTVITYSYFFIFKEAKRQRRQIEAMEKTVVARELPSQVDRVQVACKNKKAAYTIGIVIGLYVLFAMPSMVVAAIQLITTDKCLKTKMKRYFFWGAFISFASSACNPWVYAARMTEFRQAYKVTLSRCKFTCPFSCDKTRPGTPQPSFVLGYDS